MCRISLGWVCTTKSILSCKCVTKVIHYSGLLVGSMVGMLEELEKRKSMHV